MSREISISRVVGLPSRRKYDPLQECAFKVFSLTTRPKLDVPNCDQVQLGPVKGGQNCAVLAEEVAIPDV